MSMHQDEDSPRKPRKIFFHPDTINDMVHSGYKLSDVEALGDSELDATSWVATMIELTGMGSEDLEGAAKQLGIAHQAETGQPRRGDRIVSVGWDTEDRRYVLTTAIIDTSPFDPARTRRSSEPCIHPDGSVCTA